MYSDVVKPIVNHPQYYIILLQIGHKDHPQLVQGLPQGGIRGDSKLRILRHMVPGGFSERIESDFQVGDGGSGLFIGPRWSKLLSESIR